MKSKKNITIYFKATSIFYLFLCVASALLFLGGAKPLAFYAFEVVCDVRFFNDEDQRLKIFLHHRGQRGHRGKAGKTLSDFIYFKATSIFICSSV
jgi:hypothetical protein